MDGWNDIILWVDEWMNGQLERQVKRQNDGWINRTMDGWTE